MFIETAEFRSRTKKEKSQNRSVFCESTICETRQYWFGLFRHQKTLFFEKSRLLLATISFTTNIPPKVRLVEYHGKTKTESVVKNDPGHQTNRELETFDYSEQWKQDAQGQWYRDFSGYRWQWQQSSDDYGGGIRHSTTYIWSAADPLGTAYEEYDDGGTYTDSYPMAEDSSLKHAPLEIHDRQGDYLIRHSLARGVNYHWDVSQAEFDLDYSLDTEVSAQSRHEYIVPARAFPDCRCWPTSTALPIDMDVQMKTQSRNI